MLDRNVLKTAGRKSTDVRAIPTCGDQLDLWCLRLLTVIQKLSLWCTHSVSQIINFTLLLDHVVHHTSFLGSHSELQPQSVPYSRGALTPLHRCRVGCYTLGSGSQDIFNLTLSCIYQVKAHT